MRKVYVLVGMETKRPFYIGETKRFLAHRLREHKYPWETEISPKANAIRVNHGNIDIVEVFCYTPGEIALDIVTEAIIIAYFIHLGYTITNTILPSTSYANFIQIKEFQHFIPICESAYKKYQKKVSKLFGNL